MLEVSTLRLLLLTLVALGLSGCAQCGGAEPPVESQEPTAQEDPTPAQSATAGEQAAGTAEKAAKLERPVRSKQHPPGTTGAELIAKAERKSHPSLKSLRVASRKLLAADKVIVENQPRYQATLDKTVEEMKALNLSRRMPSEPVTAEALRPQVEALVLQSRLKLLDLKVGSPSASRAIPETHPGPGPYAYHPDQLIGQQPVSIIVGPADDRNASALYERLKSVPGTFIDVNAVMGTRNGKRLVLSGVIPMLRALEPPKLPARTPSLSELARMTGVEVPEGDYPTEDIQKNLDAHRELLGELDKSQTLLAKTHLLGLQLRFARQRIEANSQRPFPTPMGRRGPDLQNTP